jgi:putative MFS transporter
MLIFTALAIWQFVASSFYELLVLRILLGVVLGGDYTSSKTLVTEYLPTHYRGPFLSLLGVAWAAGYVSAYIVGYILKDVGGDAWRYILLSCALPSFLVFLYRLGLPESALWLIRNGRIEQAQRIIMKYIGADVALPIVAPILGNKTGSSYSLFVAPYLRLLVFGTILQCSFVIPFYALGTFLPLVMSKLGVADGYTGALIFNLTNLAGAFLGIFLVDRLPRRTLLLGSFVIMALLLAAMITWEDPSGIMIVPLFTMFAFVVSSGGLLAYVYPAEIFPTELRARGIGTIGGLSRIGTATTTFFLPVVVDKYGVDLAVGLCAAFLIFSTAVCYKLAPETLGKSIS